jgi:putative restriction endonuclease
MATWEEFISELKVWKRGHEVAVHKPLLLLFILAQAKAGGTNRFPFKDLVDDLEKAIRDFGLPRQSLHAEYPFWHLQDDTFWVIEEEDDIPLPKGRSEPTKRALLDAGAVATVPLAAWQALTSDPSLIEHLASSILARYWPDPSLHGAIKKHVGLI